MDKYRQIAIEVVTAYGGDGQKQACENYKKLLKEVGATEMAERFTDADMVESAKFFLKTMPPFFRTI